MNHWQLRHDYYEYGFCPKCGDAATWSDDAQRLHCLCGWVETDEDIRLDKEYWANKEISR